MRRRQGSVEACGRQPALGGARYKRIATFAVVFLLAAAASAAGQQPTTSPSPVGDAQLAGSVREYVEILKADAQAMKEATERDSRRLERALYAFIGIVTAFGGLVTFLGWVSKKEIRREVRTQMRAGVASSINDALAEVDKALEDFKNTLEERLRRVQDDVAKLSTRDLAETSPYPNKRIIWVDDQPNTTEAARAELETRQIITVPVKSTEELEAALKRDKTFDLIVSDMRRNGYPRAGLDYLETIADKKDLPPRLIFAPKSLVDRYPKAIDELKQKSQGKFLGAVMTSPEFFKTVYDFLGKSPPAAS